MKRDPVTYTIGASSLKEASRFRNIKVLHTSTDYNALSQSSFLSPNLQRKTKGFVNFDL